MSDQIEAMTLADRILVLREGCVEQIGESMTHCERPESRFVAGFIGSPAMSILPARAEVGGVRPEDLRRAEADEAALFEGRVAMADRPGDTELVHLALASGGAVVTKPLRIACAPERLHLFDASGRALR